MYASPGGVQQGAGGGNDLALLVVDPLDGRDDAVDAGLHGVRHFIGADHVAAMEGEKVVAHAGGTAGIVGADGQINLVQLGQLGRGFQHGRGDGALGVQNAQGIAAVALADDF